MQEIRDIEQYSKDYQTKDHSFEKILVKYRIKKIIEILEYYKPKNILEIGCGPDSICNYYNNFEQFTIVEPSKKYVLEAIRNKRENIKVYTDFVENKIEKLKNENFDFIILSSLLHEVVDPNDFLKQIIILLKKNTILHINVPNSRGFHLLWAYAAGLIKNLDELTPTANKLQQHSIFNLKKLQTMVKNHNLEIIDQGTYFVKPFNHKKMLQLVNENIIDEKLLDGLYNLTQYMPELGAEVYVNCRLK